MTGAWTMTDEGEFILNEPYSTKLAEAKRLATQAWLEAIMSYLSEQTPYSDEELLFEFQRRSRTEYAPTEIVDSFVIEALEGTLVEGTD